MAITFIVPRQSDQEVVSALIEVAKKLSALHRFTVHVDLPHHGAMQVGEEVPESQKAEAERFLKLGGTIAQRIFLTSENGHQALVVTRQLDQQWDRGAIVDDWAGQFPSDKRPQLPFIHANLLTEARKTLKTTIVEAALADDGAQAWAKYRTAQTAVLSSLQKTAEQVIVDVANKNAEIDKLRAQRFEELEAKLRLELATERETLSKHHEEKTTDLQSRIKAHEEREAQFQTKEARYVSRQKQDEQIKQIQEWLNNWALTKGTTQKRWPVTVAYIVALAFTGAVTIYATIHNYELIKTTDDLAKLAWWQWVALASKSFFPLAAFTTFMVYLIRWDSAWARQHSEEEFRNRTRLIDIGRAGWLLEAVRDAHEKNAEIPTDLLRELSRNLFSNASSSEGDIHPSALSDVMLQGLTSLRVKTADGSEVEASRAKSKK
jgi:hypothetical protein